MLRTTAVITLVLTCILAEQTHAQPAHIIMIRHAEKPTQGDSGPDNVLSLAGKARAAALVPYLTESPQLKIYGRPSFIFAQAAPDSKKNSLRPIETVQPFADSMHLTLNKSYERDQYKALADELLEDKNHEYAGKTVLICWEHDVLAHFAQYLAGKHVKLIRNHPVEGPLPVDPTNSKKWAWPGEDVYGRTWVISYDDSKTSTFRDYPQQLMYGDAKNDAEASNPKHSLNQK